MTRIQKPSAYLRVTTMTWSPSGAGFLTPSPDTIHCYLAVGVPPCWCKRYLVLAYHSCLYGIVISDLFSRFLYVNFDWHRKFKRTTPHHLIEATSRTGPVLVSNSWTVCLSRPVLIRMPWMQVREDTRFRVGNHEQVLGPCAVNTGVRWSSQIASRHHLESSGSLPRWELLLPRQFLPGQNSTFKVSYGLD